MGRGEPAGDVTAPVQLSVLIASQPIPPAGETRLQLAGRPWPPRACPVTTFVQRNEHPAATTPHKTDPALLKRQTHSTSGVPSTVYASHVGPGLPTWAPASYVLLICIPGRVWARHPVLNQCPGVSEWCNQTFQLHGSTCPFLFNTVAPGTDSPGAGEALLSF